MTTARTLHLSASSISAYKACPTRFRFAYVEGIRQIEDKESQRVGTNWHKLHEVYRHALQAAAGQAPAEYTEAGEASLPFNLAIAELNRLYENMPASFDADAWEIERTILAMSFAGHCWFYSQKPVETLATELEFKLPVIHPKTNMPLDVAEVVRVGKIDQVIRYEGKISISDYKSTSKPIDADSTFWNHLRLDSQISMYVLAAMELHAIGQLPGVTPEEEINGAFYDVWHKPTIKPAMLTAAETAAFVSAEGKHEYEGTEFKVTVEGDEGSDKFWVSVNGRMAEIKPLKKGFAIRETPEMYGARLLKDIYTRPDFYFARREIPRTRDDIEEFREELYHVYQSMKATDKSGHYFHNEQQCEATFRCPYIPICYHGVKVTDGQTPDGFKRIFANLTVDGEHVEI